MSKLPCFRYKVSSNISLYREQKTPNMIWTKRWKVLTIENITNWASKEVRTINITQGMGGSSCELEVREFVPIQGDLLEKFWTIDGVTKTVKMTAYTIVDIGIDPADLLIRTTYERASRHAKEAPKGEEKRLLRDALYLWVAVRMSSTTEWIIGDEQLDMSPVTDLSSPYYNQTPIPPVISAQGQIIAYSKILEPLKRRVVKQLASMSSATDTRKNWFTIYLTYFILLLWSQEGTQSTPGKSMQRPGFVHEKYCSAGKTKA
ncbi:uncharacterized protein RSE6_06451 [Rhynchosporium secalis]|uniref:Uncharacterized protein n=1 Tax=Rhynchosporium secalis TaxID=38038 RepID=A0A1E1MAG5_RHYSE|nr:uncharacterized protein RSE6_06451 [Rhynchosporium secalis]